VSGPRIITIVALGLALVACSSDAAPPAAGTAAQTPIPPVVTNDNGCTDSSAAHPPGSTCVKLVRGQLLDHEDMPVSAPIAVCGGGVLCVGSAADEGIFEVTVNRFVDLSTFVLHVYGHPHHGDMIVRLPSATASDVTLKMLPRVPRYESTGGVLPASTASGTVVRSGPIELTLAPGTVTDVAPAHVDMRQLLVGTVRDAAIWDPDLIALYAVGPFSAQFSPKAAIAITLPAGTKVADGTKLDLVVLEDDLSQGLGGTLKKVGSATVTGGVARSVADAGIERLTWVGVRVPKGG